VRTLELATGAAELLVAAPVLTALELTAALLAVAALVGAALLVVALALAAALLAVALLAAAAVVALEPVAGVAWPVDPPHAASRPVIAAPAPTLQASRSAARRASRGVGLPAGIMDLPPSGTERRPSAGRARTDVAGVSIPERASAAAPSAGDRASRRPPVVVASTFGPIAGPPAAGGKRGRWAAQS